MMKHRLSRSIFVMFMLIVLSVYSKYFTKSVSLNRLSMPIYLTHFMFLQGDGDIDFSYTRQLSGSFFNEENSHRNIKMGMLLDTDLKDFLAATSCEDKTRLYYRHQAFHEGDVRFFKRINLNGVNEAHRYYFYLDSCGMRADYLQKPSESIELTLILKSNGMHIGQGKHLLKAYLVLFVIWAVYLGLKFTRFINMSNDFTTNSMKTGLFASYLVLGCSYFYHIINQFLNIENSRIILFDNFAAIMKYCSESVSMGVLVAIGSGWSIVRNNNMIKGITLGALVGIFNIISSIYLSYWNQAEPGTFLHEGHQQLEIITRLLLLLVFLKESLQCLSTLTGHKKKFLKKFVLLGTLYLLCWPVITVIAQTFLPIILQKEIIFIVNESSVLISTMLMCGMMMNPQSPYRAISINPDDNPLHLSTL